MFYQQRVQRAEDIQAWQRAQLAEFDTDNPDDLPPNVRQIWDEHTTELREHLDQIRAYDERDARLRSLAADPARRENGADPGLPSSREPVLSQAPPWLRVHQDRALSTIDRYVRSGDLGSSGADRLDRLVRTGQDGHDAGGVGARYLAAVGNSHYNSAFGKLLQDPQQGHLRFSPAEVDAVRAVSAVQAERAMSVGSGSAGGFAIPFSLDPSVLLASNGALNPWRQIARIETVVTNEWRGISSDGVSAGYVPEGTEATDNSPTLAQPTIVTERGQAFVPFSIELGQDWAGLQAELLALITDARDVLDAGKFLTGAGHGSNEPEGVLTGLSTTQRVQTATTATFAYGDPWTLKAAIPARFQATTTFAANPATWDTAYRFVGAGSTDPVQMDGRGGGFLGRPKVEASAMATGSTTGTKLILAGDFQRFCIVDRVGMTIELIPHLFGTTANLPTGQRGFYAFWRSSSKVLTANAFRYLEVK